MTSSNEIDSHFVKCLGFLHASSKLRRGDPVPLQYVLEEAIKIKYGIVKDYTDLVQACLKPRENVPLVNTPFEESKGSNSDNELELDLLKEDLMCVICNGMDVGARNRLLECSDCHSLYHQECHKPGVTEDSFDNWVCYSCKVRP
nr:integrator complex subunit 12 isoform X2 [Leptinotarsa decemlineata]